MPDPERWWRWRRIAANGRNEVQCKQCGAFFWLHNHELSSWPGCIHCLGIWKLDDPA